MMKTDFSHDLVYFATVEIGLPPKSFRVLVRNDIPDTFVSSVNCTNCVAGGNRYDVASSSTSTVEHQTAELDNFWVEGSGEVIKDDFRVGDTLIKAQSFVDASSVYPVGLAYDNLGEIHGTLGLSPSSEGSALNGSSVLMNMATQGVLDKPVMTLRLQEPKKITFGLIDDTLYIGDIQYLPLTHRALTYGPNGTWQTTASYVTLGSSPGVRYDLDGLTASFSTVSAAIVLPISVASSILQNLEFETVPMVGAAIPCHRRSTLPDLTFNLAGKNFTLTPYEYTLMWPYEHGQQFCVSAIDSSSLPPGTGRNIVLGNAFLRKFYSVFDLDGRIGFANLSKIE